MNSYQNRFTEILEIICKATPPETLVEKWISHQSDELQDWVGSTYAPWWLQNIGVLDAAHAAAIEPIEGDARIDYRRPT